MNKRVVVGISGGIDSFYTAFLLKERGFDVMCLYINLFDNHEVFLRAKMLSDLLGAKFEFYDAIKEFKKEVIDRSINMTLSGYTPNPCAFCNMKIKFRILEKIRSDSNYDYISTGHYVKIFHNSTTKIFRGFDEKKDQSYFLALVPSIYLKNAIFPLGNFTKKYVKRVMEEKYLFWKDISSSQDLCFVKKGYKKLIQDKCGVKFGKFLYKNRVVANHWGSYLYTLGESRGLGHKEPVKLYVESLNHEKNEVYLNTREFCYKSLIVVADLNFFNKLPNRCLVQIRYQAKPVICDIHFRESKLYANFHEKVFAPTPGQIASFYSLDNRELLGGGIIIGTD
ncbi:tRNA-specific 2-thiouridylase [Thermodesulfobium acidiphilum]|uniref:tRNA-uridine 2-sulfurtransferase n=1 Tax=Thermodesulfobium acidiphilum TaxID=1794699 RepID=A0A2R4W1X3_THEAF|nr:aminomethyltransferase beta-barrel domain-containing protein [Thermodesulfobium acidiphilum]AWB10688.1 tRNA-specific 2-thiouridylase [Thermodesulfobium acidiphilum]